ncbi:steroid 17-alpha-hydroxylase/17,20 lyase-like [Acanthaster planci]|uniref:Steroid 21-hydroxylase n=1 Tax=Acanthaster planci TaxID=133434 RepID=A0A8B7YUU5_ACAPL|nr:steroid 17-alpha-hydroxylase/17,20 lyase-like [Acanthaster planci]
MVLVDLVVFLVVLLAVCNFMSWRARRHLNLPPGPPSIPLLGNFNVFMSNRPIYKVLKELADKYGSIFSLKLPMGRFVVLSEVDVIREAFLHRSEDFSGRPYVYSVSLMTRNNCGIAFSDYSPSWRMHRRTTALAIRRNMKGYNCMPTSAKIQEEVAQLNKLLSKKDGMYTDISAELNLSVLNVICDMTFGQRYEITDTDYQQMLDCNNKFAAVLEPGDPIDIIPALKIFPSKKLRMVQEIIETRDSILQKKYDEHFRTFDPNNIRDLTDAFIATMLESTDGDCKGVLTEDHVVMAMWELFVGGYEATYKSLVWAIIYVLNNPQVQDKIQRELAQKIGTRLPVWDDRHELPYLEATIMETLRCSSFSSMNGPRRTRCDTKVQGYDIPKDSTVFCNLWWVHHNPKYWKHPMSFRPERFLDEDGKVFTPKSFMAFSIGRRACLGENLAKMELFMFLGGILQRFQLRTPAGEKLPDTEPMPDMMRSPNFFKVQIACR